MAYKTINKWKGYDEGVIVDEQEAKDFLNNYKKIGHQEFLIEVEDVVEKKVAPVVEKVEPVKKKTTKKKLFKR